MQIDKIYFDMDGVLADFCKGAEQLGGYVWKKEQNHVEAKDDTMWDCIRSVEGFYLKLDLMPGAKEMFDSIYQRFSKKCEVLTGIPKPKRNIKNVKEDKITWMHERLAADIVVNECNKEDKWRYCKGKGCVLIDDMQANIDAWEAAGGTGILYEDAESTLQELERIIEM